MKKKEAIAKLRRQLIQIEELRAKPRFCAEFTKWHRDTEVAVEHIFGSDTRHLMDFRDISYDLHYSTSLTADTAYTKAYMRGLDEANSILQSLIQEIDEYWPGDLAKASSSALLSVENLCNRFHLVVRQLKSRHDQRTRLAVDDEYDVQDLFRALLMVHFDDIRGEEWTPSYAGGSSRMDFLLKEHRIVVEAKKTRRGLGQKELGEQLIVDIGKYGAHPDCGTLCCFVYDPDGIVGNPKGIEKDLSGTKNGLAVRVFIRPTGG